MEIMKMNMNFCTFLSHFETFWDVERGFETSEDIFRE